MIQSSKNLKGQLWLYAAIIFVGTCGLSHPAYGQNTTSVNKKALEKSTFYSAPREIQILDERPVVKDFREAPENAGSIDIPPGPNAGSVGGHGGGALGPNGGAPGANIPAGGLQLPAGNSPTYREAPAALRTLPKSGFGGSNIPARGMGPRGLLPGITTGVVGKIMAQNKPTPTGEAAGPAKGMKANSGRTVGNTAGPAAASYSGGYGTGAGPNYGGSASRTETFVRGSLLRKNK
jgi:hypothetical protein